MYGPVTTAVDTWVWGIWDKWQSGQIFLNDLRFLEKLDFFKKLFFKRDFFRYYVSKILNFGLNCHSFECMQLLLMSA
jgi:hypothetical protein